MGLKHGISTCIIVYNAEKQIKECLESVKDISNEILVVHDGPCKDKTLEIAKKYTKNIFVRHHRGQCEFHQAFLYRKAKYNWILKIDADEFLSKELKANIRKLIENPDADAYSFLWLFWNAKKRKYVSKNWDRKICLYRKDKISYIAFPNWGEPKINGKVIMSNLRLEHHPQIGNVPNISIFINQGIRRCIIPQAKATLQDFSEFERFNYSQQEPPLQLKIRKKFPLLSALPFALIAFFKVLFSQRAWKEGNVALKVALSNFAYYLYLGYYIYLMKKGKTVGKKILLENFI